MTAEQLLSEIADYCRRVGMAESTFGRRAVNDGKLVGRLRIGGRVTMETVGRVRGFMSEHPSPEARSLVRLRSTEGSLQARANPGGAGRVAGAPGPSIPTDRAKSNFRFYDNRQKYLLFVNTCSEKWVVAQRVAMELANIHPRPPALRMFDAGVGDGTVLARVLRAMHQRHPTMPFYAVGKEISLEDVRLALDRMPDRFFEHPATVLVMTNLYYSEAPWLAPKSVSAATSLVWKEVALRGATSSEFEQQITELQPFLSEHWRASVSPATGNPAYVKPVVLVFYREDHKFLLDQVLPRRGSARADYDLVIASQPYRARASVEFKAKKVLAPLARSLGPGGRMIAIQSHGRDPGLEIVQQIWPGENPFQADRHALLKATRAELGAEGRRSQLQRLRRQPLDFPLRDAHAARGNQRCHRHLDPARSLERRRLCGADRGPAPRRGDGRPRLPGGDAGGPPPKRWIVVPRRVVRGFPKARLTHMQIGETDFHASPEQGGRTGPDEEGRRIAALLMGASIELCSRDPAEIDACVGVLEPGTCVYIGMPPGQTWHGTVALAARLRRCGFVPVPHVSARGIASRAALEEYLARAAGDAGVDSALVIAGDSERASGPFDSSLALLETDAFQRHGIVNVGVSAYPEGHPKLAATVLDAALEQKKDLARQTGLRLRVVTQFCFEAEPVRSWTARMKHHGLPVHVGVAGPASLPRLLRYAALCGIGNSVRALKARPHAITRLMIETGPETMLRQLASLTGSSLFGLHFFAFGGPVRTARWLRAVQQGRFELTEDGGFRVGPA